jgi:hypothetical protein
MYYEGDKTTNKITMGRDSGRGVVRRVGMNGNVSIGTSTPNAELTLYGTSQILCMEHLKYIHDHSQEKNFSKEQIQMVME